MATKHKHRPKHGAMEPLQARRLLEKGDLKQALKEAKVCYRQRPGPETRQLLERAYLARGRQLCRAGLRMESRAIVQDLLDLGVTEASVERDLPELLIAVGLFDRATTAGRGGPLLQEGDPLYVAAADHAVLRPEGAPASLPAIRQGGAVVRRALAALEAGDEAQAMALLKDVPRGSPFADWKYLVRGLAAYYRQDAAGMQANWERLDPGRFAARVAAPLRALANGASAADPATAQRLARLGKNVLGGPILDRLQRLQELVLADRWPEVLKLLRASGPLLDQVDPALPRRIGQVLYATLVRKADPTCLRELAAVVGPPPIDPRCNRGLAMACERSEEDDPETTERYWRAYLQDLARLECLLPAERTLAQALVWLRLGRLLLDESHPICPECGVCHEPDESLQGRAVECFENSVKLAPALLRAYQALANAFETWEKPEQAALAYRRLLERFPENLDALLLLANYHLRRDEPHAARDFLFRAQRLRPLDPRIKAKIHALHLATARHHALAGRWDEGRAELAAAEKMDGPRPPAYRLLVQRAVLEMKAGQGGPARDLLCQAQDELGEAAPLWLLATIEGTCYNLPEAVLVGFEDRWATARKKGRSSLAAGEMCRILDGYLEAGVVYLGRKSHVELLVDFLRRCLRTRWQAADLRSVLELLIFLNLPEQRRVEKSPRHADPGGMAKLLEKYAAKARAKFPDVAFFQLLAGEMEMRKGPRRCNRRCARECFQQAAELAQRPGKARLPLPPMTAGDEPGDADASDDDGDAGEGVFPGGPAGTLFQMFARACREDGVDPEEILDEIGGGMPFRFRPQDDPKPARKNRR
jgi:tetratricopeptide (TPR) repeat protein